VEKVSRKVVSCYINTIDNPWINCNENSECPKLVFRTQESYENFLIQNTELNDWYKQEVVMLVLFNDNNNLICYNVEKVSRIGVGYYINWYKQEVVMLVLFNDNNNLICYNVEKVSRIGVGYYINAIDNILIYCGEDNHCQDCQEITAKASYSVNIVDNKLIHYNENSIDEIILSSIGW